MLKVYPPAVRGCKGLLSELFGLATITRQDDRQRHDAVIVRDIERFEALRNRGTVSYPRCRPF
jgi:hypothetical protein